MPDNAESVIRSSFHSDQVLKFPEKDLRKLRVAIDLAADGKLEQALDISLALVDRSYEHANWLVGEIYEFGGPGVEADAEKAAFYYRRGTVTVGSVLAWLGLARLNFLGQGIPQDFVEAHRCYSIVAEDCDHPVAWLMLGWIYLDGKGVSKDIARARSCLEKAAKSGHAFAARLLGRLEHEAGRPLRSIGHFLHSYWLSVTRPNGDPRMQFG